MRGRIIFNGNISAERDFVFKARESLLDSLHQDEAVRKSLKVLLITAGWGDEEYQEVHIKEALREIGIPPDYDNIQNLSAHHAYLEFCRREPTLGHRWAAREELINQSRRFYLEKNAFYATQLRRTLASLKERCPNRSLAQVLAETRSSSPPAHFDGDRLLAHFLGLDLRDTINRLVENDDRMVELLHELDEHFVAGTGLHYNHNWLELRADLERRILSANSIFLFGGHLRTLHRALNFFRLRETLLEALRRGASFYTVSAGSLILCERIIVYDDFATDRSEFQLFDRGFGLVRRLQLFPHCMDRIQTDDPDNLCYLAYRFQNRTCVGLNQDSFLMMEADPEVRCTSAGVRDGVYVFDTSGAKVRYNLGEEIPLLPVKVP